MKTGAGIRDAEEKGFESDTRKDTEVEERESMSRDARSVSVRAVS